MIPSARFKVMDSVHDHAFMEAWFQRNLSSVSPSATHARLLGLELLRRFEGKAFGDPLASYKDYVVKYSLQLEFDHEIQDIILFGYAGSDASKHKTFRTAKSLQNLFSDKDDIGTMKPLLYDDELGLFLAHRVAGTSLLVLMQEATKDINRLEVYAKLAAKFLRILHGVGVGDSRFSFVGSVSLPPRKIHEGKLERVQRSEVLGRGFDLERFEDDLYELRNTMLQEEEYVLCHADFHQDNIYCDNNQISVIDYEWCHFDTRYLDLAAFCSHMDILVGTSMHLEDKKKITETFLDEYWGRAGGANKTYEADLFHVMMAQNYLRSFYHFFYEYESGNSKNPLRGARYAIDQAERHLNLVRHS